ncbi:MAG: hypothetical protein ABL925_20610, partial [Methylococcales bacterium]
MQKTTLNDEESKARIREIRKFCERSVDTGGVLMVTGPRGTGKTRIVDEALNERLYSAAHHS